MAPHISEVEEGTQEERHFRKVISTFRNYARYSLSANNRRRKDIYRLPFADQQLISTLGYKQKLDEVDEAIRVNAEFLSKIVENPEIFNEEEESEPPYEDSPIHDNGRDGGHSHAHSHSHGSHGSHSPASNRPTEFDMDKLRSTLKQFVRDWSAEGKEEREACYGPMKQALLSHFQNVSEEYRANLRVLVPGAGLGRLAFDIASLGFACQGNEFSHYMLLSSYFVLNRTDALNSHSFYPYIHSFSNAPNKHSMLRRISIPDVLPSSLPSDSNFSLVAAIGDFEEVYGGEHDPSEPQAGQWHAIMTCFFIDTAKNIVNYLRLIHKILAPGGVWINLGPLLWHWENNESNEPSIELDLEEVKALAHQIGFDISNEMRINTTYTNNSESMLGYVYNAALWTATKRG